MWFIGDVHGEWRTYRWMINKMCIGKDRPEESHHWFDGMSPIMESQASFHSGIGLDQSLQVGDWGVFDEVDLANSPGNENHRFFRGNHDNPELINRHPACLGDFGFIPDMDMFFAAGGYSIDGPANIANHRVEYVDWWPNEELTASQWWRVHELYQEHKPKIVVSHECPNIAKAGAMAADGKNVNKAKVYVSGTEMMLQQMYDEHEPELWIFGHYHYKMDTVIGKTRFICCGSLGFDETKNCLFEVPGLKWPDDMTIIR